MKLLLLEMITTIEQLIIRTDQGWRKKCCDVDYSHPHKNDCDTGKLLVRAREMVEIL